ncbi:hypothetical protein [Deinococcus sp. QL22]|uniref:hypothetical protein n=1 Tax=Deinococcus sp. QL22 TaxID=2939437 RepID=UPI00201774B5|nr:hypothetical protein [Deinococcus sp. QL22]UQN06029.1 hypothetical protein M1R55_14350 [Deinococcus sp. QL22]
MNLSARSLATLTLLGLGTLAPASAQGIAGTVTGSVAEGMRVSGWAVTPSGQAVQEIVSVPINNSKFRLELPAIAPSARAQTTLSAQNVSWPGVIDPVTVSAPVQTAEVKFFTYRDTNRSGQRDDNEPLNEVTLNSGSSSVFVAWVGTDVTVKANRGYEATLKRGWNVFLVDVGRAVKVSPYLETASVSLNLGR